MMIDLVVDLALLIVKRGGVVTTIVKGRRIAAVATLSAAVDMTTGTVIVVTGTTGVIVTEIEIGIVAVLGMTIVTGIEIGIEIGTGIGIGTAKETETETVVVTVIVAVIQTGIETGTEIGIAIHAGTISAMVVAAGEAGMEALVEGMETAGQTVACSAVQTYDAVQPPKGLYPYLSDLENTLPGMLNLLATPMFLPLKPRYQGRSCYLVKLDRYLKLQVVPSMALTVTFLPTL